VGKRAEIDSGMRAYVADRMKALKRENGKLRQAS
jgi:hypothetical protein